MRFASSLIVLSSLVLSGCADAGMELGNETGGTWGAGAWELPPQVKRSFEEKYPQGTVAAWDRHNFEGGESVYDIVYHDRSGQSHTVRLSAMGEVLPQPRPDAQAQAPATEQQAQPMEEQAPQMQQQAQPSPSAQDSGQPIRDELQ